MRPGLSLAVALSLVGGACTGGMNGSDRAVRTVGIDAGGTGAVVVLAPATVEAAPGDLVRIEHSGVTSEEGTAAIHGLVAAQPDRLPPLFVPAAGGAVPNGGVWGACRGGTLEEASFGCPVPPIEGPAAWDGRSYWSTGAMLPGEHRDVPLSADIRPGTYSFVCAFHPLLRLSIRVTEDPRALPPGPAPSPASSPSSSPGPRSGEVLAGFETAAPPEATNAFVPRTARVRAGEEVSWSVSGRDPHEVVFSDVRRTLLDSPPSQAVPNAPSGPWDGSGEVWSGFLSTDPSAPGGTSFSLRFAKPGRYSYFCLFHAGMTGTVVVGGR